VGAALRRKLTRRSEHARAVEEKTRVMTFSQPTLTTKDLARISVPVLVMAGDDDVATLSHTCSMYEAIREAQLAIVPARRTCS